METPTEKNELELKQQSLPQEQTLINSVLRALRASWDPQPIEPPQVDPELPNLPAVERISETIKYNVLCVEYSLSSGGGLRAWVKLNLMMFLFLLVPSSFSLALLALIVYCLTGISAYFLIFANNFFTGASLIFAGTFLLTISLFIFRGIKYYFTNK